MAAFFIHDALVESRIPNVNVILSDLLYFERCIASVGTSAGCNIDFQNRTKRVKYGVTKINLTFDCRASNFRLFKDLEIS